MTDLLPAIVALLGSLFLLLAAVALFRMPDSFGRLSATGKAVTLGAAVVLAATALATRDSGVAARAMAGIAFFFLTAPIAGYVLGRAAWRSGAPRVVTVLDEFTSDEGTPAVEDEAR
ncbi:MAG: monovalent cation/H(+) antiporter subunit G [Dehalococcoidia bacterium]|nr:monovalent cation/H(+) antiporter subunit G [Dehalococcoidia bacterium]